MQGQADDSNSSMIFADDRFAPMSELVGSFDWSVTPLGPKNRWPESLQTTVRILLTSRFPMWMAYGPELTFLYNDSYARTTLGKKHPWALGKPASEVWSEIWKDIGPLVQQVMETGEASWDETMPLILERSGYREETYHTFSYSPLAGPSGAIEGMFCVVMEDTGRVIGERQLGSLGTLAAALVDANTKSEVFAAINHGLTRQKDIPFALTYLFTADNKTLRLVAYCGIDLNHPAACSAIHPYQDGCPWPVAEVLNQQTPATFADLSPYFPDLPTGVWDQAPRQVRIVPITRKGQQGPAGVFIAAVNPYRQLDQNFAGYLDLLAGQIAASITNAEAYEQERDRAEALEDLDRAKTAFFSNISHELRTPLTLILGPIEDALSSSTPLTGAMLDMLHRNAVRLLKLVNGLLDFVRIEAGRLRASYEPTDLSAFTAQIASAFRSAVERAGLQLVVDCPPLPEPAYVDREMWEKIVLNLLSNALKSTFEGQIRVAMEANESEASLVVSDTGTGIAESELPHLFERFRRVEGAKRRSHEGSGIGLAMVKELVEMHSGSISVQSRVGAGTTFTVSVPFGQKNLAHGSVVNDQTNPAVVQGSANTFVREALGWLPGLDRLNQEINHRDSGDRPQGLTEKATILLVDDNADMLEYVRGLLSGFSVVTAENGLAALDRMREMQPDLVLTDVMMPEMDGFALLAAIRENPATRITPVIMLSARAGEDSRIEGVDAGADDYLIKPFSSRELLAHVEAQLKLARLRREAMAHEQELTREIQQARQFAWETLEHLPEAFCTFDPDFRVTYLNPAAARMISGAAHEPGFIFWDLYPVLLGTPLEANFRRAMEQGIELEFEQYFSTDRGDLWFQFQLYPRPEGGLILYVRNTTDARRTEQALRRSELLATAGRLAASIAHEINNPLEAVTNLLFLAKSDENVATSTRNLLEVADRELQRLSHITARSLKFYRQRTAAALASVEELMESVLFFHETDIRLRSVQLERRYRESPQVLCFGGEIQQVFTNLLSNALQALEDGGRLVVAVRASHDATGRAGVIATVADTGSGMDHRMLERLFHPFVTTKGDEGTGLGLWVSKGIVDKHHGHIAARSRKGAGTVFRVFVPVDGEQ